MRRHVVTAGVIASVLFGTSAAFAAPCGPAVLANVDGQVLVNRGAGFLSGTSGMPLAVGDYVMSRGGSAQIAYVNGGAASLKGAKSMPITACSADAGNLTDPALAQFPNQPSNGGWTVVQPSPSWNPSVGPSSAGSVGPVGVSNAAIGAGTISTSTMVVGGLVTAGVIGGAVAIGASGGNSNTSTIISVSP